MSTPQNTVYEFGRFRLDKQKRRLCRDGETIPLTAKAMEMLVVLVDHQGEIVTKQHLMASIWPDSFVEEANLPQHVFHLRKALGEAAEERNYILTVPGKGYCFTADVRKIVSGVTNGSSFELPVPASSSAKIEALPELSSTAVSAGSRGRKRAWLWLMVAIALGIASAYPAWRFLHPAQPETRRIMLAVLPFENLTGDAGQDYFSDGLTEEMISQLGRLDPQRLGVIARTSVMHYNHSQTQLAQVSRELGIEYVLEGSVRRDANHVRISTELIQMKDQTHVWAREYDRDVTSLLSLQDEIAREVADEIQLTLGDHKIKDSARAANLSANAYQAYDLYLKGRYFWNQRTPHGFRQAAEYFRQAIAKDPGYAPAYAGLADTYALMSTWYEVPQNEYMPKARAAALKAMEIDETLAEAHASLALVAESYDYDWQTAEKEYRRAIELDPAYATAHQWYGEYLSLLGRFPEALAESERARQLDPFSAIIATDHAAILLYSRNYDRAIEQAEAALEMQPSYSRAYSILVSAKIDQGKFAEALADVQKWDKAERDEAAMGFEAHIYGRMGKPAEARHALAKLKESLQSSGGVNTAILPLAYTGMDRKDEALRFLQEDYSQHSNAVLGLKVDPFYDSLRSDPRFQDLLHKVGLAP